MPSQRRIRVTGLLVIISVLVIIYYHSSASRTRDSEFYLRTANALDEKHSRNDNPSPQEPLDTSHTYDRDPSLGERLKEAEQAAKKAAEEKDQRFIQQITGDDKTNKPVAGRVLMKDEDGKKPGVAQVGGHSDQVRDREGKQRPETEEEHMVETLLGDILKKGPIIIFSKSYCRFSAKAKRILLEEYTIVPEPYVVELDKHEHGAALQSLLADRTGRKTVPNVLINGLSVGGGDDIENLHQEGKLISSIQSMGGKRIVQIALKDPQKVISKEFKR